MGTTIVYKVQIIPLGCSRINCTVKISFRLCCLIFLFFFLLTSQTFASGAELTNIVVKNDGQDLFIDLMIQGVYTNEMKKALISGISVSFTFIVILYEVNDFWFDKKVASTTTSHKIQYDALKNEYQIARSWEKTGPLVVNDFDEAGLLMSKISSLKITPFNRLKKNEHYQLRVKSELDKKKFTFTGFPWEFETDWYTINFIN
jgi:hypothetical protein